MREDKEVFDAIFRRAVEWMANCEKNDSRGVEKHVERTYVVLHVTYVDTTTMRVMLYDLMLHMDGKFSLNNGKGEYVPYVDPMGAFEEFIEDCIKARGDD